MNDITTHARACIDEAAPRDGASPDAALRFSIGIDRKVSDGNYGSAGINIHLAGITEDTTEADIDSLIEGKGKIAYARIVEAVRARMVDVRRL